MRRRRWLRRRATQCDPLVFSLVSLRPGSAIGKLVLSLVLCMLPCLPICCIVCGKKGDDAPNFFRGGMIGPCVLFCFAYVGVIVWWIVDIVFIAQNRLPDGAGFALLVM